MACGMGVIICHLLQLQDRPQFESMKGVSTPNQPVIVEAADVESMHWIIYPSRWQAFYRASKRYPSSLVIYYHSRRYADLLMKVRYRSEDDTLHVSGIGQGSSPVADGFDQACLWARSRDTFMVCGFDCHYRFDTMVVEIRKGKNCELGYAVHAGCWLLIDRILGGATVKENLQVFKRALRQFWIEGEDERHTLFDPPPDYNLYHPISRLSGRGTQPVSVNQDPVCVVEVQYVIERATCSNINHGRQRQKLSGVPHVPLEIAMLIVDTIYHDYGYSLDGIADTRNLLVAFQWDLPVSYWQSRCKRDLIFEVKDLIDGGVSVDWRELCLGLEELLFDEEWYGTSGLRNRGRIFGMLRRIDEIFRSILELNA